jgi:hypothetical protein
MLGHERELLEQDLSRELAGIAGRIVLWRHLDHVGRLSGRLRLPEIGINAPL